MRALNLQQVLELHERILQELYPSPIEKSAALGFSLIMNHPFVDGNKRVGHAAMEVLLILNGLEIAASIDEQEQVILSAAAGKLDRQGLADWLGAHIVSAMRT
jgi:death on curing protein